MANIRKLSDQTQQKSEININEVVDSDGNTALHIAVKEENIQDVQKLLNHNADVTLKNQEGLTAERTEGLTAERTEGFTAIEIAAEQGNAEIMKVFLEHYQTHRESYSSDPAIFSRALHIAASHAQEKIIKLLREYAEEKKIELNVIMLDYIGEDIFAHLCLH